MKVSLSECRKGSLAIVGHVGYGHCHSHNGYTQDDSAGLAVILSLFQKATGISLSIKDIRVQTGINGIVEVETEGGGYGSASARRGITLQEARLAKSLIGREAICTQTLVLDAFGRFYGQGVHETPVALQTAISNAALDTFVKCYPDRFQNATEEIDGSCGLIVGTVLDLGDIPVSVLGTVNASKGGIGPNEDLEGNSCIGAKKRLMAELGMLSLPTIVVESMVYSPVYSKEVNEPTFFVRHDPSVDNPFVAQSIIRAAQALNFPVQFREGAEAVSRVPGRMAAQTKALGQRIADLGLQLQDAEFAQDKISILAELAILVSQDGAGISFMTNKLHEVIGGAGMIHGTGAVFNYIVPVPYRDKFVYPFLSEQDVCRYVALTEQTVMEMQAVLYQGRAHAETRVYGGDLDEYVRQS